MPEEPKTVCRTPATGRSGTTNIPTRKYDAVRAAVLSAIKVAGVQGLPFKNLPYEVKAWLSGDQLARLGSVGWHTTSVKLNMEVEGEIKRLPKVTPQRLIIG